MCLIYFVSRPQDVLLLEYARWIMNGGWGIGSQSGTESEALAEKHRAQLKVQGEIQKGMKICEGERERGLA